MSIPKHVNDAFWCIIACFFLTSITLLSAVFLDLPFFIYSFITPALQIIYVLGDDMLVNIFLPLLTFLICCDEYMMEQSELYV